MKMISEHLGRIIVALAGIALLITAVVFFKAPIGDFFSGIVKEETNIGNQILDNLDDVEMLLNGSGSGGSGGSGSGGGASLPAEGTTLEAATWSEIKAISEAGKADEYFNVGDEKVVEGLGTVQIAGFNHDTITGSTKKAGITFVLKDLYSTKHVMNSTNTNAGGWADSEMRSWLNSDVYNSLPSELKSSIKAVDKIADDGSSTFALETSSDKLWLFSFEEVGFTDDLYNTAGQGTKYDIFTDNASRVKEFGGAASLWWLRSSSTYYNYTFRGVNINGSQDDRYATYGSGGVAFGFCI